MDVFNASHVKDIEIGADTIIKNDTEANMMDNFVANTIKDAEKYYHSSGTGTINKAMHLMWLAGRVSAYGIACQSSSLIECREAEDTIKHMVDKLLGYDVLHRTKE